LNDAKELGQQYCEIRIIGDGIESGSHNPTQLCASLRAKSESMVSKTQQSQKVSAPLPSCLLSYLIVGGVMHALRGFGQKALQDKNSEVIYQGKMGLHRIHVHIVSKSAKMMLSDRKWASLSSDMQSSFSSSKASEAKQFTPSWRPS
jgi:hypothetical protein